MLPLVYLIMLAIVVVVAVRLGLRWALTATVVAIGVIDFFFLAPKYSLALLARTDAELLVLFGGTALIVTAATGWLRKKRDEAERNARQAAGIASLMQRDAAELSHEVDALHSLRSPRHLPRDRQ